MRMPHRLGQSFPCDPVALANGMAGITADSRTRRIFGLTLVAVLVAACDRTGPVTDSPSRNPSGAQQRLSVPMVEPCPGWGHSLAARDLSGRCRAYPKPTAGALEAEPAASKKNAAPKKPQEPPATPDGPVKK